MARRGTEVDVEEEFSKTMVPIDPDQTSISFNFYYTDRYDGTYCDDIGMKKLGSFTVDLPDTYLGLNRPVKLSLRFASMESTAVATAKNETNGEVYRTKLAIDE